MQDVSRCSSDHSRVALPRSTSKRDLLPGLLNNLSGHNRLRVTQKHRLVFHAFFRRTTSAKTVTKVLTFAPARPDCLGAVLKIVVALLLLAGLIKQSWANTLHRDQETEGRLKQMSLEQVGSIKVTTAAKEPVKVARNPAAIYVITQEDIRRSGATSIPELLRLVPGVEVARIDSNQWSLSVRGFGSSLSRSVLVLIDGR